jgi:hypothetical protein
MPTLRDRSDEAILGTVRAYMDRVLAAAFSDIRPDPRLRALVDAASWLLREANGPPFAEAVRKLDARMPRWCMRPGDVILLATREGSRAAASAMAAWNAPGGAAPERLPGLGSAHSAATLLQESTWLQRRAFVQRWREAFAAETARLVAETRVRLADLADLDDAEITRMFLQIGKAASPEGMAESAKMARADFARRSPAASFAPGP